MWNPLKLMQILETNSALQNMLNSSKDVVAEVSKKDEICKKDRHSHEDNW